MGRLLLLRYCSYIFLKRKNIIPFKTKLIIRNSNFIKSSLQNMDSYGGDSIKQLIEIIENASVLL